LSQTFIVPSSHAQVAGLGRPEESGFEGVAAGYAELAEADDPCSSFFLLFYAKLTVWEAEKRVELGKEQRK